MIIWGCWLSEANFSGDGTSVLISNAGSGRSGNIVGGSWAAAAAAGVDFLALE